MPEGPFGLPRITDFGPFTGADVDAADIQFLEEETENRSSPPEARQEDILSNRVNKVEIYALYDSRGDNRLLAEAPIDIPDFIFERRAGYTNYYYDGDIAWSGRTKVKYEFRMAGLGNELLLQKLDSMRSRGISRVYAIAVSEGGKALLDKTGFRTEQGVGKLYVKELE